MNIRKAFEAAFARKKAKNWEKIYVVVDIHDTILRACYEQEETFDYFPHALQTLRLLSCRKDICLILWSACNQEKLAAYRRHFAADGIRFDYANENPEVGNTALSDFDEKLYFNVGIDDKFGFEADADWKEVADALQAEPEEADNAGNVSESER